MTEDARRTRLQEWGSRPMTGKEKALLWIGGLLLLALAAGIWLWAAGNYGDDRHEREDQLNERYREQITIDVSHVGNKTQETFIIDGVQRPDCTESQDGYLTCSDEPQPTREN